MQNKIIYYISFAALALGLATTSGAQPQCPEGCGTIRWNYSWTATFYASLWYTNCTSGKEETARSADDGGFVCAKVGSNINLGPQGLLTNYTPGEKVKEGENLFICRGWVGTSTGSCERVTLDAFKLHKKKNNK